MIQDSITLYPEPVPTIPVVHSSYGSYKSSLAPISSEEIRKVTQLCIENGIDIGSKFRYKQSGVVVTIVCIEKDLLKVTRIKDSPGIFMCSRSGSKVDYLTPFSVT